jgi:hypothetical protein
MAGFCGNCGFPLGANSAFCSQCGTRQSSVAASASPAALQQPMGAPVARSKSGSGFKIIVIVLICFMAAGLFAIGALFYAAHRVKQAVVEKAATYGVDLHNTPSSAPVPKSRRLPACQLLTKEEASQLLGVPLERAEPNDEPGTCLYYGPPGLSEKLARANASSTFQRAQAPGSSVGGGEVADSVTKLMRSIAAAQQPGGRDAPLLTFVVAWEDGKSQMTAMSILNSGVSKMDALKGGSETIPNLGDRAIRLANLGLNVLKGDTLLRIIPGPIPGANEKAVVVARALVPRV